MLLSVIQTHYLILYDPSIHIENCITIDENVFPLNLETVSSFHGSLNRNGWYLQQLLKLYAGMVIPNILNRYLVIDTDTFFLKPTIFIENDKCLYNYGTEYHKPYFTHMLALNKNLERVESNKSGICHHMMFETIYIKELINMIEKEHNDTFYNDNIKIKYKNINEYKFIPIGWSAGCYLALYFAQIYSSQCIHVILLDSALWTPNNMKIRLNVLNNGLYPITNKKFKKMIQDWKSNHSDIEDAYKLLFLTNYIRSLFISKHLKIELPVPTLAFVNIQKPEKDEWSEDFNNKLRLAEVKILEKNNPDNYKAIIFTNKSHYIFNMIQPAKIIIKQIKDIIKSAD